MSMSKETIVGTTLSRNGIYMLAPPPSTDEYRFNAKKIREYCAQYFTIAKTNVVFVTTEYDHVLVENAAEAEAVWRKRPLWYVLVLRADVLDMCREKVPIHPASEVI